MSKKQCFVIMPFSQTTQNHTETYWTLHFEKFLKPLIEGSGVFEAVRSQPIRDDIVRDIITKLIDSPVVVADLTDLNPNVLWELGVRQSFKHGTISIAQEGTKLPFDIGSKSTLFYRDSNVGNEPFSGAFKSTIAGCQSDAISPDSTVLETISGRGTFYQIIRREETLRCIDALSEELLFNQGFLELFFKCIEERKNLSSVRFHCCAMEQLLATKYLDAAQEFYNEMKIIYTNSLILNNAIIIHGNNHDEYITFFGKDWKTLLTTNIKERTQKQMGMLQCIRQQVERIY